MRRRNDTAKFPCKVARGELRKRRSMKQLAEHPNELDVYGWKPLIHIVRRTITITHKRLKLCGTHLKVDNLGSKQNPRNIKR